RLGGDQLLRPEDARGEQRLPEQTVLPHGEAVARRKRDDVVVGMKNAHDGGRSLHRCRQFLEGRRVGLRARIPRRRNCPPVQWWAPGAGPTLSGTSWRPACCSNPRAAFWRETR